MKFLTEREITAWCNEQELLVTPERYLRFEKEGCQCLSICIGDKPSRLIALADYLVPTWGNAPFEGALLWIREKGVWSDFSERSGETIIQLMRLAKSEAAPVGETPGHLFGPGELFEMHSYFLIPLLFGWDAFLVPQGKGYFIFLSHDGFVKVVSRSGEILEEVRERVTDWNPQEDRYWYAQHACG